MNLKTIILSLFLVLVSIFEVSADILRGITVSYTDSTADYQNSLSSIGRVEMKDGKAILVFKDSNAGKYILGNMSDINRVPKSKVEITSIANKKKNNVATSANSTSDKIRICGVNDGEIIRLFTSKGKLVYLGDDKEMNLAVYPSGVYILQVGREVVKIVKN